MTLSRDEIQKLLIRVCRDSGWQMEWTKATILVGKVLDIHPMDVWCRAGIDIATMEKIAKGEHPVCKID